MIKWLLGLFGFGKIKSVESIMSPIVKTHKKLKATAKQNDDAIEANQQRIALLGQANTSHEQQSKLALSCAEALEAQLKPLKTLGETE